jgi:hypothetical protein
MRRPAVILAASGLVAGALALSQARAVQQSYQERRAVLSQRAEAAGLAEPFTGITAGGTVEPELFAVRSTGVSTEPVQRAAAAFLDALTGPQRARSSFAVDDPEWRKWMNQHFYLRQGVSFAEMSAPQRETAFGLLRESLSAKGLRLSRDIMRLNHTLGELNHNNFEEYGEWLYHLTVMGQPSATEPWGWQLDGHHLIINYFVLGDQVVMTSMFVGSEPVTATSGKYKGTTILQDEQAAGLAMINSLDEGQRRKAILEFSKAGNNNLTEAFKDNAVLAYAGVPASELSPGQRDQLVRLIQLFVDNLREGHARVRMEEVRKHLNATRFAWIGGTGTDAVFYFRVHSPVILIEFDHQRPINLRHLASNPQHPTRQHIHVVVRTPNGNDYGKDLLRQHYQQHRHD